MIGMVSGNMAKKGKTICDRRIDDAIIALAKQETTLAEFKSNLITTFGEEIAINIYKEYKTDIDSALNFATITAPKSRELRCYYITGTGGSGKTVLAKYLMKHILKSNDYYVSASGNHPMDDYAGERGLILDDYRASTLRFADFLKMIDNNNSNCVSKRYHNVSMHTCKLAVITTTQIPCNLYSVFTDEEGNPIDEPMNQFYRRINWSYFEIETCAENKNLNKLYLVYINPVDYSTTREYRGTMEPIFKDMGIDPEAFSNSYNDELDTILPVIKEDLNNRRKVAFNWE